MWQRQLWHTWLYKTFFLGAVFANGFSILLIEILGARLINPYFGNTIFVWSSIISVTLGALAFGYWLGGKIGERISNPITAFYGLLSSGGSVSFFIPFAAQIVLPALVAIGYRWGPFTAAVSIFFIPLALLAIATTVAVAAEFKQHGAITASVGKIFAVSTLGSIAGAVTAGFFIIPVVGVALALKLTGAIIATVGVSGFLASRTSGVVPSLLLVSFPAAVLVSGYFLPEARYNMPILFQKDGFYGEVRVVEHPYYGRCILVDNMAQGCEDPETGEPSFPVYRALLEPLTIFKGADTHVLFLGLGAGVGPKLIKDSRVQKTIVELDPLVLRAAETYFKFSQTKNQRVVIDDARGFLRKTVGVYDLIVMDLYRGASSDSFLWTTEMFQAVKKSLKRQGILSVNLPGVLNGKGVFFDDVLATLRSVFPHVVARSENPAALANILIYASSDENISALGESIGSRAGLIMTDLKNTADLRYAETALQILTASDTFFGR